ADAATERRDQRGNLRRGKQLVEACFLDVQDFSLEGQDSLELAVASLLCRAPGGIPLYEVELTLCRIALLAVGKLARQPEPVEDALAARHLARLARRFARACSIDDLGSDDACILRPLVEVLAKLLGDDLFDHRPHFGRDEF